MIMKTTQLIELLQAAHLAYGDVDVKLMSHEAAELAAAAKDLGIPVARLRRAISGRH